MPEYISALRNNYNEKWIKQTVSLYWLFPIPDSVYLSQQNVQRGYFGKTCQISCRYPNYGHLYEMKCTCKKQYCSHIKCYQVWKITCNNVIYGLRLIIWQESLFWLVFQNVIKITSILSLLNEATTIKNIFQNPLIHVRIIALLVYVWRDTFDWSKKRIWMPVSKELSINLQF